MFSWWGDCEQITSLTKQPQNGHITSNLRVISPTRLLMVGGVVTHPTATSKPCMPVSRAPKRQPPLGAAPQCKSPCQAHGNLFVDCHLTPVSISKDAVSGLQSTRDRCVCGSAELAERPKTRLPFDSEIIFYTVPILRQAQDRQSAYPSAFPMALAF